MHKTVWYDGGLQLADTGTKNFREDALSPRLGYAMAILHNLQNTCQRGMKLYRILGRKMCSE